jgi:predicted DNA-binding transcriptional regulator AlpA
MSAVTAEPIPLVPDRLLSLQDLADFTGISPNSLRWMSRAGKIPAPIKIGRHLRWRPDQVRALIGQVQAAAEG